MCGMPRRVADWQTSEQYDYFSQQMQLGWRKYAHQEPETQTKTLNAVTWKPWPPSHLPAPVACLEQPGPGIGFPPTEPHWAVERGRNDGQSW